MQEHKQEHKLDRPFSCAHRFAHPDWSEAKNVQAYGSDYSLEPMGHNVGFSWRCLGDKDKAAALFQSAFEIVDHKYINKDLTYFLKRPMTPEQLCIFLANKLAKEVAVKTLSVDLQFGKQLKISFADKQCWRKQYYRLQAVTQTSGVIKALDANLEVSLHRELQEDGQVLARDQFDEYVRPLVQSLQGVEIKDLAQWQKNIQNQLEKLFQPLGFLTIGRVPQARVKECGVS